MYSNILVPLDTNRQNDQGFKAPIETAIKLIGNTETIIHLMSAIPFHWFEGFYPNIYKHELANETKEKLKAIMAKDCPRGTSIDVCVEEGGAISSDILKVARELSVDTIVMGSHMPTVRDYFLGSHAAHIALHAPCSVFVVRTTTYSKILVPVDTNYESDEWLKKPLETACEIAQKTQASMLVMSVVPDLMFGAYSAELENRVDMTKDRLEAVVEKFCPHDVHVEVSVVQGGICHEILRVAREQSVDAIVMASHGPMAKDYLIGSNAAHVVLHAPCSVSVIREDS